MPAGAGAASLGSAGAGASVGASGFAARDISALVARGACSSSAPCGAGASSSFQAITPAPATIAPACKSNHAATIAAATGTLGAQQFQIRTAAWADERFVIGNFDSFLQRRGAAEFEVVALSKADIHVGKRFPAKIESGASSQLHSTCGNVRIARPPEQRAYRDHVAAGAIGPEPRNFQEMPPRSTTPRQCRPPKRSKPRRVPWPPLGAVHARRRNKSETPAKVAPRQPKRSRLPLRLLLLPRAWGATRRWRSRQSTPLP